MPRSCGVLQGFFKVVGIFHRTLGFSRRIFQLGPGLFNRNNSYGML